VSSSRPSYIHVHRPPLRMTEEKTEHEGLEPQREKARDPSPDRLLAREHVLKGGQGDTQKGSLVDEKRPRARRSKVPGGSAPCSEEQSAKSASILVLHESWGPEHSRVHSIRTKSLRASTSSFRTFRGFDPDEVTPQGKKGSYLAEGPPIHTPPGGLYACRASFPPSLSYGGRVHSAQSPRPCPRGGTVKTRSLMVTGSVHSVRRAL